MEALTQLRQGTLDGSRRFNHRVLSKILAGPLEVLPAVADVHPDGDEEEAAVLGTAIYMSGNEFDKLIRSIH